MKNKKMHLIILFSIVLIIGILYLCECFLRAGKSAGDIEYIGISKLIDSRDKEKQLIYEQYIESKLSDDMLLCLEFSDVTVDIVYDDNKNTYFAEVAITTKDNQVLSDDNISSINEMIVNALENIAIDNISIMMNGKKISNISTVSG
jgi:type III secretory pathway lipoprotein EscJ